MIEERLYSTGNEELDYILEKAFCDGFEFAQKEYANVTATLAKGATSWNPWVRKRANNLINNTNPARRDLAQRKIKAIKNVRRDVARIAKDAAIDAGTVAGCVVDGGLAAPMAIAGKLSILGTNFQRYPGECKTGLHHSIPDLENSLEAKRRIMKRNK